jgi:DNA-directed RNA polymerase subunit RPC12/RpoP
VPRLPTGKDLTAMEKFRQKVMQFMQGRYGFDEFSRFIVGLSVVLLIVTMFCRISLIYYLAVILLIYAYYRMFSRRTSARYAENQRYLQCKYRVLGRFNRIKFRIKDSKTHRIYKCPNCSQKIRVPKGKGRISIKCPKCRIEFIKKT